jgi:hypothetical protein
MPSSLHCTTEGESHDDRRWERRSRLTKEVRTCSGKMLLSLIETRHKITKKALGDTAFFGVAHRNQARSPTLNTYGSFNFQANTNTYTSYI